MTNCFVIIATKGRLQEYSISILNLSTPVLFGGCVRTAIQSAARGIKVNSQENNADHYYMQQLSRPILDN